MAEVPSEVSLLRTVFYTFSPFALNRAPEHSSSHSKDFLTFSLESTILSFHFHLNVVGHASLLFFQLMNENLAVIYNMLAHTETKSDFFSTTSISFSHFNFSSVQISFNRNGLVSLFQKLLFPIMIIISFKI